MHFERTAPWRRLGAVAAYVAAVAGPAVAAFAAVSNTDGVDRGEGWGRGFARQRVEP